MMSILSDNRFISKKVKRIRRLVTEKNREDRRNNITIKGTKLLKKNRRDKVE